MRRRALNPVDGTSSTTFSSTTTVSPDADASRGSINPSLSAHISTSAASAKSATASLGFPPGTKPKYRKNGSFGHAPYDMMISAPSSTPSSPARSWKKRVSPRVGLSRDSAISRVAAAPWHSSGDVTTRTCAVGLSKQWLHMSTPGTARCVPLGPCVKHRLCSAPAAQRRSSPSHPTAASRAPNAAPAAACAARTSFASSIANASWHASSASSEYSSGGVDTNEGKLSIQGLSSGRLTPARASRRRIAISADHGSASSSAGVSVASLASSAFRASFVSSSANTKLKGTLKITSSGVSCLRATRLLPCGPSARATRDSKPASSVTRESQGSSDGAASPVDARVETARGDAGRERTADPGTAAADVPAGDIDARMLD